MRIAIFRDGPWLPAKEGGSFGVNQMIRALMRKRIEIILVRCYRGWDDIQLYKKEPYTTILLREEDFYGRAEFVADLLAKNNVDVAHFDSPEILEVYCNILHNVNIPVVWEIHNIHSDLSAQLGFDKKKISALKSRERHVSIISDAILCRSRHDLNRLLAISSAPKSKFHIYRGCIETNQFKNVWPNYEGKRLITFGNFYYEPNKRMLLAASKIMKELDREIVLDVVGDIPNDLKKKISASNVIVHGFILDITKILKNDALLIAPLDSGSGTRVKILVAMASGIPVITTKKGAEGLECENKIVISNRVDDYPKLIMKILGNKRLYEKLSNEGRKSVQDEYDWSDNIDKVIKAYKSVAR
ncbi:glycosyltransferase family 4 protein [Candidatus Marsarchaeota archaeon]|nr:glycosyltransferase family 4 protein [Candidatus Marsarchaeota archaeon]